MKILHLITGLSTGGAERSLVKLIETSDRHRFRHTVVSLLGKVTQGTVLEDMRRGAYLGYE